MTRRSSLPRETRRAVAAPLSVKDGGEVLTNYANGSEAWDETGAEYLHIGGFVDPRDAARALKYGARLGILEYWGSPDAIEWIDVPRFEGSNALKSLTRWFAERAATLENPSYTFWEAVAGDGKMLLLWDDCSPLKW
jgi:hypothetical protein